MSSSISCGSRLALLPTVLGRQSAIDSVRPDREAAGPGAQRVDGEPVGPDHGCVDAHAGPGRPGPRREHPEQVAHQADDVGLVDGAGPADEVAQGGGGPLANRAKRSGRVGRLPTAPGGQPAGVVKWCSVTTGWMPRSRQAAQTPVVVEGGAATTPLRPARSGSTRARTGTRRARARRRGRRPRASGATSRRRRRSAPRQPEPGSCSKAHQSLLMLPPSIWWAAVAAPTGTRRGNGPSSAVPVRPAMAHRTGPCRTARHRGHGLPAMWGERQPWTSSSTCSTSSPSR